MKRMHTTWLLGAVTIAACATALVYGLTVVRPDGARLVSDSAYYADLARSLARGEGYVDRYVRPAQLGEVRTPAERPAPSSLFGPFYPALTAVAFRAARALGDDAYRAEIPIVVSGIGHLLAIAALGLLARKTLPPDAAIWPPVLLALDPRARVLSTDGLTEGWYTAALVASVTWLLAARAGAGVTLAAMCLTRAGGLVLAPVALLVTAGRSRAGSGRVAARAAGVLAGGIAPWLLFRAITTGSPVHDLQHLNLFHDVGPFVGSAAFRSLDVPSPVAYFFSHPFALVGKLGSGLAKAIVLLPGSFVNPLVLLLALYGARALVRAGHGFLVVLTGALLATQLVVSALTLLEPRLVHPVSVLLFVPAAAGIGDLSRRTARAPTVALLLVLVTGVLPFARSCVGLALSEPDEARAARGARFTEADATRLGAWTAARVPEDGVVLTEIESMIWYADRRVLWRPDDPAEAERATTRGGVTHVLFQRGSSPGWDRWRAHAIAGGTLSPVDSLRVHDHAFFLDGLDGGGVRGPWSLWYPRSLLSRDEPGRLGPLETP